jgi:hypothetical protein
MKHLPKEETTFVVELTKDEIILIRDLTQNYSLSQDINDETTQQANTRKSLFVGTSRLLGYNITDNGSQIRSID